MQEQLIVTLTSWKPRFENLPTVLDSIFAQSLPPSKVVLNLDEAEIVPPYLQEYIDEHGIEVFRMPNTKVYKKLIPTLRRYPEAAVVSIDDDWIYPATMLEDFMNIHSQHPDQPVSGNREYISGMYCHCGCASLTKAEYFGEYLDKIDDELIANCPSDDIAYTFVIAKNGRRYVQTKDLYFTNLQTVNPAEPYSPLSCTPIIESLEYLNARFGELGSSEKELSAEMFSIARRLNEQCDPELKDVKLAVCLNAPHLYMVEYYLRKLLNLTCKWELFVSSVPEGSPAESMIRKLVPDAHFTSREISCNGMVHLNELIEKGSFKGFTHLLHLNTFPTTGGHILNYMHIKVPFLYEDIVNPLIGSPKQFKHCMQMLLNHTAAVSDACYRFSWIQYFPKQAAAVRKHIFHNKTGWQRCRYASGSIFLCKTESLKAVPYPELPEHEDLRYRMEISSERIFFAALKGRIYRDKSFATPKQIFKHRMYGPHRYSYPMKKLMFLLGIPVVTRWREDSRKRQ